MSIGDVPTAHMRNLTCRATSHGQPTQVANRVEWAVALPLLLLFPLATSLSPRARCFTPDFMSHVLDLGLRPLVCSNYG